MGILDTVKRYESLSSGDVDLRLETTDRYGSTLELEVSAIGSSGWDSTTLYLYNKGDVDNLISKLQQMSDMWEEGYL